MNSVRSCRKSKFVIKTRKQRYRSNCIVSLKMHVTPTEKYKRKKEEKLCLISQIVIESHNFLGQGSNNLTRDGLATLQSQPGLKKSVCILS